MVVFACFLLVISFSGCIGPDNKTASKVEVAVPSTIESSVVDGYVPLIGNPSIQQIISVFGGDSVKQLSDEGYIMVGVASVGFEESALLLKTDANGKMIWARKFYPDEHLDLRDKKWKTGISVVRSFQLTNDGGYLLSFDRSQGDLDKMALIKTNSNGDLIFVKMFGEDNPFSIQQTSDGGYILTGYAGGALPSWHAFLLKADSNGKTVWKRLFNSEMDGTLVRQTNDGGYVIMGDLPSIQSYLMKTDSNGNKIWEKVHGSCNYSLGEDIHETSDGGYILTGRDCNGVFLTKTDSSGNTIWERNFFGINEHELSSNVGNSVQQTSDGGYILTGDVCPYGSNEDKAFLIKTDLYGNTLWAKTFGGYGNNSGESVQQTNDGGYIIEGSTWLPYPDYQHDILLIKTNSNGDEEWGYYHHPIMATKQKS